ncbi:hypothetical protein A3C59_04420 [Candidatus Daviesbacteria bacterium RIFCSPHIGHO2_02_FULL_36_13]|uniref:Uncharacterized protein n=1 Tax=Candidatus Daviesbacteria bacterium RIFCSPHIGHO2_02_FULL_36_13 TaxID=1797768 RepID=A0A1F5JW27_9BACT|nr:MAG: hypothetical protein A3C59_04420 [Candidatus Daviesbacteria bacterium RIFCSPHIGHO2_02_FULL_36_13]
MEAGGQPPMDVEPGFAYHDLKAEGMGETLTEAPVYTKFGEVSARVAEATEEVVTHIQGKEETRNTANPGDYVITGPQGEQYVLAANKFQARYRPVEEKPGTFEAFGKIRAVTNPHAEKIAIVPAWGGYQYGEPDCMVATTVDVVTEVPGNLDDIYIIDKKSFDETYRPTQPPQAAAATAPTPIPTPTK